MNQCPICGYVNQPQARFCQSCGRMLPGSSQTISLGGLVQNRYQVVRLLGQGGMGAVYLVADQRIGGKQLAMKEMSDAAITDPLEKAETIRAFQQEATLLAQLDHPNVPKVSDFFSENGKHYIVMEFVPGETLEELQKRRGGAFGEGEVVEWGRQLCEVLMYLHSRVPPIIFRDLKPGNIMITTDGKVKLIDFGIARHFTSGKSSDTIIMGTQGFAPPEQYGKGQTDGRSDIYSLGVVLYVLLTRYDPAAAAFRLPPARQVNPAISPAMGAVLGRATQMNPDLRYQSAADMLAALPVRAVAAAAVTAQANAMLPPTQVVTPQYVQPAGQAGGSRGVPVFIVVLLVMALIGFGAVAVTTLAARARPAAAPAPAPTAVPGRRDARAGAERGRRRRHGGRAVANAIHHTGPGGGREQPCARRAAHGYAPAAAGAADRHARAVNRHACAAHRHADPRLAPDGRAGRSRAGHPLRGYQDRGVHVPERSLRRAPGGPGAGAAAPGRLLAQE